MATNELKMDDYPAHWKATLMGEAFWKDAEEFNQPISDSIDANSHPPLLSRFPFNIGSEQPASSYHHHYPHCQDPQQQSPQLAEQPEKRHRRFSTSDALRSFASRASSPFPPTSRAFDLRRGRSQTRPASPSRPRRSSSILRSTFNMLSSKAPESVDASPEPRKSARIPANQATPIHPLEGFRGGETWALLDKGRRSLGLDLFLPVDVLKEEEDAAAAKKAEGETGQQEDEASEPDIIQRAAFEILPSKELEPLNQFRKLRMLKITSMIQSYQKEIWQAAWLNVELEELELEMVSQPRIRRPYVDHWPYIKGGWKMSKEVYGEPVYYGTDMSTGVLHRKVGRGEYLDKILMEKAKICALAVGRCRQRLSIKTLRLTGFVVDADPFLHWFDPKRLKTIEFKDYCVDAGFYLSVPMAKVSVLFPREVNNDTAVVAVRAVSMYKDLKVVRFEGGKKVGEIPYRGPDSLKEEIPRNLVPGELKGEVDEDIEID
ncbi:uncharacterized protein LDX57_006747 [Aspergillus melleus]|uniref:uncharacterized protein n=1 Tax=Aspergillus melleus TaxID=138277 RepID=UPI001E8ECEFA|nr:uncharacterized protein LDX57_006747 [Aspergillus melleus]KAH8429077.1 hypothetical protein LDX57_006747 [Aspergillus melleus]